jgi:hypothetical protein
MQYQIYLSHKWNELQPLLLKKSKSSSSIQQRKNQFKEELNIPKNQPIIMTGHQPIIYYPGIFIKLILADIIAKQVQGKAYYLVLDNDIEKIDWKFIWFENQTYFKQHIGLSNHKEILLNQIINNNKKNQLIYFIKEWMIRLYHIFDPSIVPKIKEALEYCINILEIKDLTVAKLSVLINEFLMNQLNVQVKPIYVSDLVKTQSFKEILQQIKIEHQRFREIYNRKLDEFRKIHHIKNPHYPFSNLKENELPFWKSDGYMRQTLTIEDDINKNHIFPKAITLSICIRIFLSDLMIHGTGGGFYDLLSEEILKEFFKEELSPHIVSTATIPILSKASIALYSEPSEKITKKLRKWKFNPEIFLKEECELKQRKMFLIHLKNFYDSKYSKYKKNYYYDINILNQNKLKNIYKDLLIRIEKESTTYGSLIHEEFLKLNHKMHLYTIKIKSNLEKQLERSKLVEYHQSVFFDRTYPAFYYNLNDLKEKLYQKFYSSE